MRRLSESEFEAMLAEPMRSVDTGEKPPFDFWPYFDAIPVEDFEGHDCSAGSVSRAYRHPEGRYEHVLVDSDARDVFMVLVLDRPEKRVVGHRLLNLPAMYGITR